MNDSEFLAAPVDDKSLDLGVLDDLLGFHLRMALLAVYRDFTSALDGFDLTQRQVATLELVHANPGTSQVNLAGVLGTDRATMMSVVDRLEKRHFLKRERSREDRRRQELHLTDAGRKVLAEAKTRIAEHERKFTSRFTQAELEALVQALKRLQRVR